LFEFIFQSGGQCNGFGLQAAIYKECFGCIEEPCLGPSWQQNSHNPPQYSYSVACATNVAGCTNNNCRTISMSGLEIDKMYYLLMDGCCGSACAVKITVLERCD
jgi:hypothetical protein